MCDSTSTMSPYDALRSLNDSQNPQQRTFTFALIDFSGSTITNFKPGKPVYAVEMELLGEELTKDGNLDISLYTFGTEPTRRGKIILQDGILIYPAFDYKGAGLTHTAKGLNMIVSDIKLLIIQEVINIKEDIIKLIVCTDGNTNSKTTEFESSLNFLHNISVVFQIIAVSLTDINFEDNEDTILNELPGLDFLKIMEHYDSNIEKTENTGIKLSMTVTNRKYKGYPVFLPGTSNEGKSIVTLMKIELNIPSLCDYKDFIQTLISKALKILADQPIYWGVNNVDFNVLMVEITKLLSIIYGDFDPKDKFILSVIYSLYSINTRHKIDVLITPNTIYKSIANIFKCMKNSNRFNFLNYRAKFIMRSDDEKKQEYDDAIKILAQDGVCDNGPVFMLPILTNIMAIIEKPPITHQIDNVKNGTDDYGNHYIALKWFLLNPQLIRLYVRMLLKMHEWPNAQYGLSVSFIFVRKLRDFFLSGYSLDDECMKMFQELARIMVDFDHKVIKDDKDSENGAGTRVSILKLLNSGITPILCPRLNITFTSFADDPNLSIPGHTQNMWWAIMMAMLGESYFYKQMSVYNDMFQMFNIPQDYSEFLKWYVKNYKLDPEQKCYAYNIPAYTSIITLSEFPAGSKLLKVDPHDYKDTICSPNMLFTEEEAIKLPECVICKKKVSYVPIKVPTIEDCMKDKITYKPIQIKNKIEDISQKDTETVIQLKCADSAIPQKNTETVIQLKCADSDMPQKDSIENKIDKPIKGWRAKRDKKEIIKRRPIEYTWRLGNK